MPERKTKLAEIKTKPTSDNVLDFIEMIPNEQKRADSLLLLDIMKQFTSQAPILWSNSIIGFGHKRYESPSTGRQVDWFIIGFSPRKISLTIYLIDIKKYEIALQRLGKYKAGGGCLYINKLSDIDLEVLQDILISAVKG
ncbi:DUF1801 domain-containing protein [Pedobacter mendelii]|uniref:DUF1801 domain-containing protein n=1 Tax=Pedobacter mendelii TaxID=1908240 RepID=UPI00361401BC